ncbi:MAG: major capsid protein [Clostridia bacterium]|nr:major capsid protein [Clostridia bacterium]
MPLDIYSTRAQLAAVEVLPREYSFLYDTFAADMGAVEDEKAIYDFRKGVKRMAPFVVPGTGGVLMERDGYETREIGFPTIAPERLLGKNDITGRSFGENVLGAMTPQQRARKQMTQDLIDMRKAVQRRREWMVRSVLLSGRLDIFEYTNAGRNINTTKVADYNFTNNYTPSTPWSSAGAKIDDDMREVFDLVYEGLGMVDVIVMDPDAASAMIHNSDYMKQFDAKNANMGDINTQYKGQGVRYWGRNADGVDMFSFSGKFIDDDGVYKRCLPSGTVIAGSRGILKVPHGPVMQVEDPGMNAEPKWYIKKEVPFRCGDVKANTISNRLTSCPTVVPFNVDAWAVMHVL